MEIMTMKPLTEEQAWIKFINQGSPTIWATITISPAMFFKDQFQDRLPPFALLSDLRSSGISIPEGRNDIDKLNALLRQQGLRHELPSHTLPRAANELVKKEATLSEAALMKLNRYALEAAFMACPATLTNRKSVPWEKVEDRFRYVFSRLNTPDKTYYEKFIYVFNFYEQRENGADWHIHTFIQGINRSLAFDLQIELNKYFGNSDVCPHYEHGVIFRSDFNKSTLNADLVLSKLVEKEWITAIDYSGRPGYALNQSAEVIQDQLNEVFPYDHDAVYLKLIKAKDGARYIARKGPSEKLQFNPFKISAR